MRTILFLPLFLVSALGCEGRYVLGDLHENPNGGSSNGGASGKAGSESTGGSHAGNTAAGGAGSSGAGSSGGSSANGGSSGASGSAGSGDAGAGGAGGTGGTGGTGGVVSGRWLASQTFVSTSSMQTALSLIDLQNPGAMPVVLETQSGFPDSFSPNGRWFLYYSYLGDSAVNIYLVDLAGQRPGQPQLLFTNGLNLPCRWTADSSRLACIHDRGQANDAVRQVVFFDASGASVGSMTPIGEVPPKSTGAAVGSERELLFLDRDHLVYSYGGHDFARITWHGEQIGAPELLGLGGGTVIRQSPDGARVLVKGTDSESPSSFLADLMRGQVQPLDANLGIGVSDSFEVAYGTKPAPNGSDSSAIGVYFTLNGVELTEQGESSIAAGQPKYPTNTFVGRRIVRTKGQQALLATIRDNGVVEQIVAGEYANITELDIDPTGSWLYIGTTQLDVQQQPIAATGKEYLSQLTADGPTPAQLVAEGYAVGGVHFAPDGQRLMLDGYTGGSEPVAFQLLDLRDPKHITSTALDLPLNWSDTGWSADSSRLSFIGGAPSLQSRLLYIVNALSPSDTPRLVVQCGAGSSSELPSCPNIATFQP